MSKMRNLLLDAESLIVSGMPELAREAIRDALALPPEDPYAVSCTTLLREVLADPMGVAGKDWADGAPASICERIESLLAKNPNPAGPHVAAEPLSASGGSPDPGITSEGSGTGGAGTTSACHEIGIPCADCGGETKHAPSCPQESHAVGKENLDAMTEAVFAPFMHLVHENGPWVERGAGWVKVQRLSDEAADALVAALKRSPSQVPKQEPTP